VRKSGSSAPARSFSARKFNRFVPRGTGLTRAAARPFAFQGGASRPFVKSTPWARQMRSIFAFGPDAFAAPPPWNGARRVLEFPGPFSRWQVTLMKISNKNIVLELIFILFDFYNYM
jgi:hypothetical protein